MPALATNATSSSGRSSFVIRKSSERPMNAKTTIAPANGRPPTTTMATAKMIHGIAHRIRARVSERALRGLRAGRGEACGRRCWGAGATGGAPSAGVSLTNEAGSSSPPRGSRLGSRPMRSNSSSTFRSKSNALARSSLARSSSRPPPEDSIRRPYRAPKRR